MPRTGKAKKKKAVRRKYVCSHCLCHEYLGRYDMKRASRPRCSNCGGPLNKPKEVFFDSDAPNKVTTKLAPQSPRQERRDKRAKLHQAKQQQLKRLQSLDTKLWFGKHEGMTIRQIRTDYPEYLQWLATRNPDRKHWRMRALVDFLQTLHI